MGGGKRLPSNKPRALCFWGRGEEVGIAIYPDNYAHPFQLYQRFREYSENIDAFFSQTFERSNWC